MEEKIKFGISKKMGLMLLLVVLVPLSIIRTLSYTSIINLTKDNIHNQLQSVNSQIVTFVDGWVDMNQRMLLQNAGLKSMKTMNKNNQYGILKTIPEFYDWVYLAFTTDLSGNSLGRSDGKPSKYYGDRRYFKEVTDGKQFGRQILIGKTSGKPAMVVSTGIFDAGVLKGVLAQAMTLETLSSKILGKGIGETGFTFMLDENGEVIAHPDAEMTRTRYDLSKHPAFVAMKQGQSEVMFEDSDGEKIIAISQKTAQGWVLVSQQNRSEAYREIDAEYMKGLSLLLATVILVITFSVLVSLWLTAPIRELTRIADKYSMGELDLKISGMDRKDEIGHLSMAVDRLGTSLRMAMNRLQNK